MIFDVILEPGVARFTCALEDYDTGPIYTKAFVIDLPTSKLSSGPWQVRGTRELEGVPQWALRLAKVLEPRIRNMLLVGTPQDLRRWIDDELLYQLEQENAAKTLAAKPAAT